MFSNFLGFFNISTKFWMDFRSEKQLSNIFAICVTSWKRHLTLSNTTWRTVGEIGQKCKETSNLMLMSYLCLFTPTWWIWTHWSMDYEFLIDLCWTSRDPHGCIKAIWLQIGSIDNEGRILYKIRHSGPWCGGGDCNAPSCNSIEVHQNIAFCCC